MFRKIFLLYFWKSVIQNKNAHKLMVRIMYEDELSASQGLDQAVLDEADNSLASTIQEHRQSEGKHAELIKPFVDMSITYKSEYSFLFHLHALIDHSKVKATFSPLTDHLVSSYMLERNLVDSMNIYKETLKRLEPEHGLGDAITEILRDEDEHIDYSLAFSSQEEVKKIDRFYRGIIKETRKRWMGVLIPVLSGYIDSYGFKILSLFVRVYTRI